jgi:hypothetical protein
MPTRYDTTTNEDWLLAGSPSGLRAQNLRALDVSADTDPLTTQVMLSVAVPLQAGELVTNITFKSGATAADTPTNYWFALYSSASTPALVGQTADQTSTAWAANTVKTLALTTPYRVTTTGVHYASIMVKATDLPSLIGKSLGIAGASAAILSSKVIAQTSGSGLTDTAPATITSGTAIPSVPLVVLT